MVSKSIKFLRCIQSLFLKSSLFLYISLKSVAFKFSNNLCMKMAGS